MEENKEIEVKEDVKKQEDKQLLLEKEHEEILKKQKDELTKKNKEFLKKQKEEFEKKRQEMLEKQKEEFEKKHEEMLKVEQKKIQQQKVEHEAEIKELKDQNKHLEQKIENIVNKVEKQLFEPSDQKTKVVNITIQKPVVHKKIHNFKGSINVPLMSKLRGTKTRKSDKIVAKFIVGGR